MTTKGSVLALDVGGKRIGVAVVSLEARLPRPLTTLDAGTYKEPLKQIIDSENVNRLIIGLPRGLEGQETDQTTAIRNFAEGLKDFGLPLDFQDESVTSKQAESELQARGQAYNKGDIDALAATYILDDWLKESEGLS